MSSSIIPESRRSRARARECRTIAERLRVQTARDQMLKAASDFERMQLARESIRQRGDFVGGHRVLTAAAGMAGQADAAAAALQELRRAQPNISLAWLAHQMPFQHDADRKHYLEGFRRAGLD